MIALVGLDARKRTRRNKVQRQSRRLKKYVVRRIIDRVRNGLMTKLVSWLSSEDKVVAYAADRKRRIAAT